MSKIILNDCEKDYRKSLRECQYDFDDDLENFAWDLYSYSDLLRELCKVEDIQEGNIKYVVKRSILNKHLKTIKALQNNLQELNVLIEIVKQRFLLP